MCRVNVSRSSIVCLRQVDLLGKLPAENESKRMEHQLAAKREQPRRTAALYQTMTL